jgi:hypothetical protein
VTGPWVPAVPGTPCPALLCAGGSEQSRAGRPGPGAGGALLPEAG